MEQTGGIQQQNILTKYKNSFRIHLFSICYLVSFVSYTAITTMMYSLYAKNGLMKIAIIDGIFAFIGMGPSNVLVLHILRKYNLKKALIISFFGLLLFQITVMVTTIAVEKDIPVLSQKFFIYSINLVASILVGISNSILWTIMPMYIQHHCDLQQLGSSKTSPKTSITANIGLFWSIYMWCSIIGGAINIFLLGFSTTYIYLFTLIILGGLSILMVMLLVEPFEVKSIDYNTSNTSTRKAIVKLFFQDEKTKRVHLPNIFVFNIISGFFFSFYRIFINRLIQKSLPQDIDEQDFNREVAIVFIFQGFGSIITGILQNKIQFLEIKDKKKALVSGLSIVNVLMIITIVAYNLMKPSGSGYWCCIVLIFFWAGVQIYTKTYGEAYIRQYNGGQLQYYSLSLLFFSIGSIMSYLIQSIDNGNIQLIIVSSIGILLCILWFIREASKNSIFGQTIIIHLQQKGQQNGNINQDLREKLQV